MSNKYCKDCVRWYNTGADQCEVPNCGITQLGMMMEKHDVSFKFKKNPNKQRFDSAVNGTKNIKDNPFEGLSRDDVRKATFFLRRSKYIHTTNEDKKVYGHPSELNYDNTCEFFLSKHSKRKRLFLGKLFGMKS